MLKSLYKISSFALFCSLSMVICWFSVSSLSTHAGAATSQEPPMEITFTNDLISANLVNVPLIDVLDRLKQEFGFKAHYHGELTEPVTLTFTDVTLAKCLRMLTANHSLSVASKVGVESKAKDEGKQIAEIWVFSRNSNSKGPRNVAIAPAYPTAVDTSTDDDTTSGDEAVSEQDEKNSESDDSAYEKILSDPNTDPSRKRQAIQQLAKIGDSSAVMTMASFLDNKDSSLRELLVNGLSSIKSEESTQVLGLVFQDDTDPNIRKIALWELGKRKDDASAQAIIKEAQSDGDEELQTLANQLLGQ